VTEVAFHFNAPDRTAYACRLLRKAVVSGAKLVVTGPPELLKELDTALWMLSPIDFVAHCFADSDAAVLAASPVVLAQILNELPHRQVLLNLGPAVVPGFDSFERVIEVVSLDDADRQAARQRWKQYTDLGFNITRHDLALKTQTP
jgi:DNA polymerase-3 subunit chi